MEKKPWHGAHWPEGVPTEIDGYEKPLFSILDDTARQYPRHAYTLFSGAKKTFSQVKETADRISCFLAFRGIVKGDRVAIILPNLPHYPAIYFGILKAGGVCVPCNPVFTASELKNQIRDSGAKAVFCMDHPDFYRTTVDAVRGTGVTTVVVCNVASCLPRLKGIIGGLLEKIPKAGSYEPGHLHFDAVVASHPPECPDIPIDPTEDLALILYTGGTTGTPKGAALTHANMMFDLMALINHPHLDQYDLTSLMGCFCGGAPLSTRVTREFEEKTGAIIFEGWGLSETAPVASANPTSREHRKIGSVGFPMPSTDIKIVDMETGLTELSQGEDGEMAIFGPQVMKGYWQRPDENEAVFRQIDGKRFFLSGDIGHMDAEGFFHITERKKDMIIMGGFKVYPKEVEEILCRHPKVALAAVIGLPHPRSGETVKAFIKPSPGESISEEEILEFCRQNMAGYKRPRSVVFRDEIPTSMVGKVMRRVLREEALGKGSSV